MGLRASRTQVLGQQVRKLWPRLGVMDFSSDTGGQGFMEREEGTGPSSE